MSPITLNDARALPGRPLFAADGSKVGKIADVYVDADTDAAEWALVQTGLFGGRESFVPLAQARAGADGVHVPYTKDQVKGAPSAEPDGELSQVEEERLYTHYGMSYSEQASASGLPAAGAAAPLPARDAAPTGRDTSGPETDSAMTRSEERLRVGVVRRPSQTVRLRKYVVTEQVRQTVPVSHEEVRVVREPITEANVDRAMDGPAISEEEHEVALYAERPVVAKEAVPVERVRLGKEQVTEHVSIEEQVRKEHIEVEGDAGLTVAADERSR